jgi:hypothetical protein
MEQCWHRRGFDALVPTGLRAPSSAVPDEHDQRNARAALSDDARCARQALALHARWTGAATVGFAALAPRFASPAPVICSATAAGRAPSLLVRASNSEPGSMSCALTGMDNLAYLDAVVCERAPVRRALRLGHGCEQAISRTNT